jgi:endonuclease G
LEAKTGIDFFCNLPDEIENQVESVTAKNVIKAWGVR